MEVDEAMKKLGFFGKWQIGVYLLVNFTTRAACMWQICSIVWIGYRPPHHCKVPTNSSVEEWIPLDASGKLSSCLIFVNSSNHTTACINGWTYDDADSGPTIVTKWDLVCDRSYIVQTSQVALTFGLSMAFVTGKVADIFGRKLVLLICNILLSLVGFISTRVDNLTFFITTRFFVGFLVGAITTSKMVYLVESFSIENRTFYIMMASAYFGLAASILPFIAYLTSNWIYLQLFICVYGLIAVPLTLCWLPETVPWLHANNRTKEAEKTISRSFKMNKIPFTQPILKPLEVKQENESNESVTRKVNETTNQASFRKNTKVQYINRLFLMGKTKKDRLSTQYSIFELFRNRFLRRHMILALILIIDNIGYYGVTYMSASLSVNRFLSAFLGALIEVPACILIYFAVNRFGRKIPVISFHILGAISILPCIITVTFEEKNSSQSYGTLACNVLFKFFMSGAYGVIFIYGAEIFPTNLRNQAVGICFLLGRFGTIIASYSSFVIELYAFFGCITLLGGVLFMVLPETSNLKLPETVQDIEAWYNKPHRNLTQEEENEMSIL